MSDVAMASVNGTKSPQPQTDSANPSLNSPAKRKRAELNAESVQSNSNVDVKTDISTNTARKDPQERIVDFIEIVKKHDTNPSILDHPLPVREASSEPHAKRKKSDSESTILTRASSLSYSNLDEILSDIKAASATMVKDLQLPVGSARNQYTPIPPESAELAARVTLFQKKAEDLVAQQKHLDKVKEEVNTEKPANGTAHINGTLTANAYNPVTTAIGDNKLVLTLYGNAPGAKQLFSSLQKPIIEEGGIHDAVQPLREAGLPNGITTTQIVPLQATAIIDDKKPVKTFGDLFSLPSSLPPFQPPKASKLSTTRGSSVGWYLPTSLENARLRNSQSYFDQNVTSGSWLEYSDASSASDPKRKFRERALSLSRAKPSELDSAEQEVEKLENLFRNAYSSFAPSKDDSAAVVPEGIVNRLWWQRVGEKSFNRLVSNTVRLEATVGKTGSDTIESSSKHDGASNDDDEELRKAVAEWDESMIDPSLEDATATDKPIQDKDVDEILEDISEMLESLNSYQRIRNLSLNSRTAGSLSTADTSTDTAKPTEGEQATYNILKSQLSLMISMLPPYAVAKLNSDQLAELNISTKLQIVTDNYKGVMEEDEFAQRAKVAAMSSAANSRASPAASLHRPSTSSLYGNQYASTVRPGAQQYYSQNQTPIRPPSTGPQRPPATAPAPYAGQRPATGVSYRPQGGYSGPTYPHQVPRSQQQYGAQQYYQTPGATNYGQQSYGGQASPQGRYPSSQTPYQNRPQPSQNGLDYRYSNGNTPRQPSPQKPQPYSPSQLPGQPANRAFGTPTPSGTAPQDRRYFPSAVGNGNSLSPQPHTSQSQSGHLGAGGYHTVMSPAEQSSLAQRTQLAAQQAAQQAARATANAASVGVLGTSPSKQVNGGNALPTGL